MERLDAGVFRIDQKEGKSWIGRIFPEDRPIDEVKKDAEILEYLRKADFPAERCVNA